MQASKLSAEAEEAGKMRKPNMKDTTDLFESELFRLKKLKKKSCRFDQSS